jgi:hypothetical protein
MEKGFAQKEGVYYQENSPPPQQNGLPYVFYFPWHHRMDGKFIKWM